MRQLTAISLGHLASVESRRHDDRVIRWATYERTARAQLAAYARMTDDELARELRRFRVDDRSGKTQRVKRESDVLSLKVRAQEKQ